MDFFTNAIDVLQTLVIALGGGLCVGRHQPPGRLRAGQPASKSQGIKQLMAGGGVALIGLTLIPLLSGLLSALMSASRPHGRPRPTGPPGKEVIPVDL